MAAMAVVILYKMIFAIFLTRLRLPSLPCCLTFTKNRQVKNRPVNLVFYCTLNYNNLIALVQYLCIRHVLKIFDQIVYVNEK